MTHDEKCRRTYLWSWFKLIRFRHCLIPFSNLHVRYSDGTRYFDYTDIYVFGIRIARLHDNK